MKTIIAGSRDINKPEILATAILNALDNGLSITEVVSGGARGVDTLGEHWAALAAVPIKRFPAEWDKYGRSAGIIRNTEMAKYANALIAVWDGKSRGTKHMIDYAKLKNLAVYIYIIKDNEINETFRFNV